METSVGATYGMAGGQHRSATTVVHMPVMRECTVHLSFHGASGLLTYPDGRERTLGNVVADPQKITADYQRKQLIRTATWTVEVNRMTGGVRVTSGRDIGFAGTCAPESNKPKF